MSRTSFDDNIENNDYWKQEDRIDWRTIRHFVIKNGKEFEVIHGDLELWRDD